MGKAEAEPAPEGEDETPMKKENPLTDLDPPPQDPEPPAEDEIPDLSGIDIEGAVKRLGLPWKTFRKMLLHLAKTLPKTHNDLRQSMDGEDWEAARRHARTP